MNLLRLADKLNSLYQNHCSFLELLICLFLDRHYSFLFYAPCGHIWNSFQLRGRFSLSWRFPIVTNLFLALLNFYNVFDLLLLRVLFFPFLYLNISRLKFEPEIVVALIVNQYKYFLTVFFEVPIIWMIVHFKDHVEGLLVDSEFRVWSQSNLWFVKLVNVLDKPIPQILYSSNHIIFSEFLILPA